MFWGLLANSAAFLRCTVPAKLCFPVTALLLQDGNSAALRKCFYSYRIACPRLSSIPSLKLLRKRKILLEGARQLRSELFVVALSVVGAKSG